MEREFPEGSPFSSASSVASAGAPGWTSAKVRRKLDRTRPADPQQRGGAEQQAEDESGQPGAPDPAQSLADGAGADRGERLDHQRADESGHQGEEQERGGEDAEKAAIFARRQRALEAQVRGIDDGGDRAEKNPVADDFAEEESGLGVRAEARKISNGWLPRVARRRRCSGGRRAPRPRRRPPGRRGRRTPRPADAEQQLAAADTPGPAGGKNSRGTRPKAR